MTLTGGAIGLAVSGIKTEEGTFQWLPFLWATGEDIPTINSEGGRAALQLWVDLVASGSMSQGILGWTQGDVKGQFQNGAAAMMINGPWQIPTLREESPDLNWQVSVLPRQEQAASILGGENYSITIATETVWRMVEIILVTAGELNAALVSLLTGQVLGDALLEARIGMHDIPSLCHRAP